MKINVLRAYERVKALSADPNGKVYIRGAGIRGRKLYRELSALGIKVDAFLDRQSSDLYSGNCPVLSPEDVYLAPSEDAYTLQRGMFFILCSLRSDRAYAEIKREMEAHGLVEGKDFADFGIDSDARMMVEGVNFLETEPVSRDRAVKNLAFIHRYAEVVRNLGIEYSVLPELLEDYNNIANISIAVTTYCTLKCKHCSSAIPQVKHPKHFEPKLLAEDLAKLLRVGKPGHLTIYGGEPLLHPRLAEFLELTARLDGIEKIGSIAIITNGTLVPSDEVLYQFKKIPNPNTFFMLSNYGAVSSKLSACKEKCAEFNVPVYELEEYTAWTDLGENTRNRNYSQNELEHLFAVCTQALCTHLQDGKLYLCPKIATENSEGIIPYDEKAFLDIRNTAESELREALHDFYYNTKALSGCQYCDGVYPGAKQVKRGT